MKTIKKTKPVIRINMKNVVTGRDLKALIIEQKSIMGLEVTETEKKYLVDYTKYLVIDEIINDLLVDMLFNKALMESMFVQTSKMVDNILNSTTKKKPNIFKRIWNKLTGK